MRKIIGTLWNRVTRNDINDNFEELYDDVGNITGKITDEVYEEIRNDVKLNWKEPVNTVGDLPSNSETGDTRMIRQTVDGVSPVYRYDGSVWVEIQQIDSTAITEVDQRLQAEIDIKETPSGAQSKANIAESNAINAVNTLENKIMDDDSEIVKVVESGSNANGEYIRYSDGMQYCWAEPFALSATNASGGIYRSESHEWVYPKPFARRPVNVSVQVHTSTRWGDVSSWPGTESVFIRQFSTVSSSNEFQTSLIAIGRWKK